MLTLVTLPCLSDNYTFLLHDDTTGETAVIDVPDHAPILAELDRRGWNLSEIWLTHHHWDHVQGVPDLVAATGARVLGAKADAPRLPTLDQELADGEVFSFAGHDVQVMDVSGHTVGHIAFYVPAAGAAFTGDSLMAMGCGRLFEGTPVQMWKSLLRLAALPGDTQICSGHEYTSSNAAFAATIGTPTAALNQRCAEIERARAAGQATVPSLLSAELSTNPFLRASDPDLKIQLGMETASDAQVFAHIRRLKDNF